MNEETQVDTATAVETKPSKKPWIILGVIVLVLIFVGAWLIKTKPPVKYSAVFLDNGQVYFGKLNKNKLTNVYYLQVQTGKDADGKDVQQPQLVKLGAELHAPTDEINLNWDHVLFTETLKDDGSLVKAINGQK